MQILLEFVLLATICSVIPGYPISCVLLPSTAPFLRVSNISGSGLTGLLTGLDLSLFIPAMIAVSGSFGLYLYRQHRQRRRVRVAICTELENMADLSEFQSDIKKLQEEKKPPNDDLDESITPTPESVPTVNYENLTNQLTLLSDEEYKLVLDLYSLLLQYKPVLQNIHSENGATMKNQEDLCDDIQEIVEKKEKLENELG